MVRQQWCQKGNKTTILCVIKWKQTEVGSYQAAALTNISSPFLSSYSSAVNRYKKYSKSKLNTDWLERSRGCEIWTTLFLLCREIPLVSYIFVYICVCGKERKKGVSLGTEKNHPLHLVQNWGDYLWQATWKAQYFDCQRYSDCFFYQSKGGKCTDLSLADLVVLWGRNITSHCFKYRLSF